MDTRISSYLSFIPLTCSYFLTYLTQPLLLHCASFHYASFTIRRGKYISTQIVSANQSPNQRGTREVVRIISTTPLRAPSPNPCLLPIPAPGSERATPPASCISADKMMAFHAFSRRLSFLRFQRFSSSSSYITSLI